MLRQRLTDCIFHTSVAATGLVKEKEKVLEHKQTISSFKSLAVADNNIQLLMPPQHIH